jgi:hypothetical protein
VLPVGFELNGGRPRRKSRADQSESGVRELAIPELRFSLDVDLGSFALNRSPLRRGVGPEPLHERTSVGFRDW